MPIWIMIALVILIYAGLKKIKLPGNDFVLALLSFLLSFMVVSSIGLTKYVASVVSLMTVILILSFIVLMVLVFVTKEGDFAKPLGVVGLILCFLIIILTAFSQFPALNHALPGTSNSGLSSGLAEFKDYIYSGMGKDGLIFIIAVAICSFFLLKKFD